VSAQWRPQDSFCWNETACVFNTSVIFFSWDFPHKPLDAAAFERCLQFCLVKAGIQATPASTRSIAASAVLAGSASLGDILDISLTGLTPRLTSASTTPSRYFIGLFGLEE
jgi:hypothetical protein